MGRRRGSRRGHRPLRIFMKTSQKRKEKKERKERLYRPRSAGERAAHRRAVLYAFITMLFCLALIVGALVAGLFLNDKDEEDKKEENTTHLIEDTEAENEDIDTEAPEKEYNYTVIIDPGHGGGDTGDTITDELNECDLTMDLAEEISEHLREKGCKVIFTRTAETEELIPEERRIKNLAGDCMISLHTCVDKGVYYSLLSNTTENSKYFAEYFGTPIAENEHTITRPASIPCVLLGVNEDTNSQAIADGIMAYLERFVK